MIDVLGVVALWIAAAMADEWDKKHMLAGSNISHMPAQGDTGFTILLEQHDPDKGDNATTHCIGIIMNSENIVTSGSCTFKLSDPGEVEGSKILKISRDPNNLPMSMQILTVESLPLSLPDNYNPPLTISEKTGFTATLKTDVFGIVIAMTGPKMGLVRWAAHNKVQGGNGLTECGNNYKQTRLSEWPENLPEGIFCASEGNPTDSYTMEVMGNNVTIVAGLPCDDSLGSPLIIPEKGVMGVVTYTNCTARLVYVHSLAYMLDMNPSTVSTRASTSDQTTDEIIVTRKPTSSGQEVLLQTTGKRAKRVIKNTGRRRPPVGDLILSALVFDSLINRVQP